MPLEMFRLPPGGLLRYRVGFPGRAEAPRFGLQVSRPDEGPSPHLELRLSDAKGAAIGRGRVPIDRGYLAVLREVARQVATAGGWPAGAGPDAELELRLESGEDEPPPRERRIGG